MVRDDKCLLLVCLGHSEARRQLWSLNWTTHEIPAWRLLAVLGSVTWGDPALPTCPDEAHPHGNGRGAEELQRPVMSLEAQNWQHHHLIGQSRSQDKPALRIRGTDCLFSLGEGVGAEGQRAVNVVALQCCWFLLYSKVNQPCLYVSSLELLPRLPWQRMRGAWFVSA